MRTKSGRFDIASATALDEINESSLISISEAFETSLVVEAKEEVAKKLINGVTVFVDELKELNNDEFFVSFNNILIGFYKKEEKTIKPIVYLYEVNND